MGTISSSAVFPLIMSKHTQHKFKEGLECMAAVMTERKRSIIWSYFTPVNNDEASCDICQKTICHCGNTTNMTKHLKVKHP